jgi:8-hydroxy-5-deazaflavin:NADPH oxidoreductase
MTLAVVGGTGDEGFGLALRLARTGERVVIGSRSEERGAEAAARAREMLGSDAPVEGTENTKSVANAEVVFVTVPYAGQAEIYRSLREHWGDGAIVCDATTPLATAVGGRPTHVLRPWHGSAAEQARALIPEPVRLVAGFHTVGAEALTDIERPVVGDVLLCGKDAEAKAAVGALIDRIPDLRWVDCGLLAMARIVEPLTALMISVNRRYGIKDSGIRMIGRERWGAR